MKILFVDMLADIAGHTRTATTIAQALERRGHRVSFVVAEGSRADVIEAARLPIYRVPVRWAGRCPDMERVISDLHGRGEVDVVHSFNTRCLPETVKAAKTLRLPVFRTICGGKTPQGVLELKPLISLSHEIKHDLLGRSGFREDEIEVIPARIDAQALLRRAEDSSGAAQRRFREKYGLPPTSKIVLRIARLSTKYTKGVLQSADAVARLYEEGYDVRFVHIGFVPSDDEANLEEVKAQFEAINRAAGTTLAVSAQDEAPHAPDYLSMADVVVGMGRTVFEGMLFEKPTLIIGKAGFAGLIGRDDTEPLAFYNFSGRHLKEAKPYEQSVGELKSTLRELLEDEALRVRVGEFGRAYVLKNLDANIAAERYEALYTSFVPENYPSDKQLAAHLKLTPRRVAKALTPGKVHHYLHRLRHYSG